MTSGPLIGSSLVSTAPGDTLPSGDCEPLGALLPGALALGETPSVPLAPGDSLVLHPANNEISISAEITIAITRLSFIFFLQILF